jgi:carboxylesterase
MLRTTYLVNPQLEGDAFYWEAGPVGVLLSHGYTATTAEVRPIGRLLHEQGYTVAGSLLPGHGTTPYEMNRCRWEDWVAAFEVAYRRLATRCERVFVGGESMGGLLALYLASEHPEIAGVMSYAAALRLPFDPVRVFLLPVLAPVVPMLEKGTGRPVPADARWQGYPVHPLPALQQLQALGGVVRSRLPRVTQPLLIVQGRQDRLVDLASPEIIHAEVSSPDKTLHWFDNSTHCVLLDPEWRDVVAVTLHFMDRVLGEEGTAAA